MNVFEIFYSNRTIDYDKTFNVVTFHETSLQDLCVLTFVLIAINAIAAIEKYTDRGKQLFDNEELIQVWIIYHLQIIGEAANDLSEVLKNQYSVIPWQQIISLRNLLVHKYFRIDKQLVWDIALKDLPL